MCRPVGYLTYLVGGILCTLEQLGEVNPINYHNPIKTDDGLILSIDNVVLDVYISAPKARDALMELLDKLPIQYAVEVVHWNSFRPGAFREQFSIRHQDGTSFWLGAVLNGRKPEWGRVRIDFNPNKVAGHAVFVKLLSFLVLHTRPMHRTIKRFDLAIDIPVERFSVFLVKDSRAYIERRHGQEFTQYLGAQSSHSGRVKLYNKTVEAKLNYPLTRLEITIDPTTSFDDLPWPAVYYLHTLQMNMDDFKATETERFILNAILQGCGSLNQLGRKTREKVQSLMTRYVSYIELSPEDYNKIMNQLYGYTRGTAVAKPTESDKPPAPPEPPVPDWVREIEADETPPEQ